MGQMNYMQVAGRPGRPRETHWPQNPPTQTSLVPEASGPQFPLPLVQQAQQDPARLTGGGRDTHSLHPLPPGRAHTRT